MRNGRIIIRSNGILKQWRLEREAGGTFSITEARWNARTQEFSLKITANITIDVPIFGEKEISIPSENNINRGDTEALLHKLATSNDKLQTGEAMAKHGVFLVPIS